ncbi:unnamed protein product [Paramecium sonneborni]|uniref:Uncharacterized protein n=1 Tax=Paramecium sonneborni TaxID=65129 RepID=A0A8S1RJE8_9CILI|nr:unnamed protein product [Paramecium sonneborni]
MQQIKRNIKINQQYTDAERYDQNLKSISRNTWWHESKSKFDKVNELKFMNKVYSKEVENAYQELKKRRNCMLKDLYEREAREWEQELRTKGLAIYKNKL